MTRSPRWPFVQRGDRRTRTWTRAPRLRHLAAQGLLSTGSIAGHITVSGPSWASALTGVWDTGHSITGNSVDAGPFLAHPSVFTRIERADPARHTVSIGTWDQIATIAAVDRRADSHPGERWTVLVTTDHGHLPTGGHCGQTPDETANFVIARGADFAPGTTTGAHSLIDLTPTVLDLLGAPPGRLAGRSLRGARTALGER